MKHSSKKIALCLCAALYLNLITACGTYSNGTSASPKTDAPAEDNQKTVTYSRFLTKDQFKVLVEGNDVYKGNVDLKANVEKAWPKMFEPVQSEAVAPLVGGLLVWVGKQIWGAIGNQFKEEAKKHKGEFAATAVADHSKLGPQLEYVAIEIRRDRVELNKDKPDTALAPKNLFQAIVLLRPTFPQANLATYDLVPVYWLETEPAAEKVSGSPKKLTATLAVSLNVLSRDNDGEPSYSETISAEWVVKNYVLEKEAITMIGDQSATIAVAPPSVVAKVKGLPPSRSFAIPRATSILSAKVTVTEADASNAAAILNKIGEAIDSQSDTIGGIIKDGVN